MNYTKFALAAVVSGFAMWVTGGVWHNLIVANFFAVGTEDPHQGLGVVLIAYIILGGLMAYIYPRGFKGDNALVDGLKFGALMGFLWVFPHSLSLAAANSEPFLYVFQNAAYHLVEQSIGGVIIAFVYASKRFGLTNV